MIRIFDGHNDALGSLWCRSRTPAADFMGDTGQLNANAAKQGGFSGGFFALYSPQRREAFDFANLIPPAEGLPLPPAIPQGDALAAVMAQVGIGKQLEDMGALRFCTDPETLAKTFVGDSIAAILHLEGADCIDEELLVLDTLYALGLRSLGPVWSRPTIFGDGVPNYYGQDGDTGPGLTPAGLRLIERCKDLNLIIDNSHIPVKGFWQVAELGVPLVATHSNAYSVCPTTRNLTDDQLRAIGETGGMVGLNYATVFLSENGWKTGKATLDDCLRHLDHMMNLAGEDHVALGSDFDGAPMPEGLATAAGLPNLVQAMRDHGYDDALVAKLCHENWLGFVSDALAKGR